METVPDNEERPTYALSNLTSTTSLPSTTPPTQTTTTQAPAWSINFNNSPENLEIAPRCGPDRNQYLETGHLSSATEAEASGLAPVSTKVIFQAYRTFFKGFVLLLLLRNLNPISGNEEFGFYLKESFRGESNNTELLNK